MYVKCRTNLDLCGETWPSDLPECPRVGDFIESKTKHGAFQLILEVVAVTWFFDVLKGGWSPEIEMHIPRHKQMSVYAFQEWYSRARGARS